MRHSALLCIALAALAHSQYAYCWGNEGHRVTGYIANEFLTDATRQQLRALVGTDDLSQLATWMDDEREALEQRTPGSSRWHYENRRVCEKKTKSETACPNGNCITKQIDRAAKSLLDVKNITDAKNSKAQRAEALRILVHLIGDLHQPLHLSDNNDRGGNDLFVLLPREREPRRLHEVWDTRLIHMSTYRRGEAKYAQLLIERFSGQRKAWQQSDVERWAEESHALAVEYAYQALPHFACTTKSTRDTEALTLSANYVQSARTVIDTQLAKAGVRLAYVLNQKLDPH